MLEPTAAGARPPASDTRASIFKIAADSVATSPVRDRLDCADSQRSRLFAAEMRDLLSSRVYLDAAPEQQTGDLPLDTIAPDDRPPIRQSGVVPLLWRDDCVERSICYI